MQVSDWGACHSTVPSINAGLDLEMPQGVHFTEANIMAALETKNITKDRETMTLALLQHLHHHACDCACSKLTSCVSVYVRQSCTIRVSGSCPAGTICLRISVILAVVEAAWTQTRQCQSTKLWHIRFLRRCVALFSNFTVA